jgi:2-oxoisovalerate dehydrogenase E2 component (dihydrolipoyl transacylase)
MLNAPEAAILALGRVRPLPRYDPGTGALARRHVMGFSFGADHRVVDGAAVAAFANTFKRLMEEPSQLLMHLR